MKNFLKFIFVVLKPPRPFMTNCPVPRRGFIYMKMDFTSVSVALKTNNILISL
jgi:hypothetical protein